MQVCCLRGEETRGVKGREMLESVGGIIVELLVGGREGEEEVGEEEGGVGEEGEGGGGMVQQLLASPIEFTESFECVKVEEGGRSLKKRFERVKYQEEKELFVAGVVETKKEMEERGVIGASCCSVCGEGIGGGRGEGEGEGGKVGYHCVDYCYGVCEGCFRSVKCLPTSISATPSIFLLYNPTLNEEGKKEEGGKKKKKKGEMMCFPEMITEGDHRSYSLWCFPKKFPPGGVVSLLGFFFFFFLPHFSYFLFSFFFFLFLIFFFFFFYFYYYYYYFF